MGYTLGDSLASVFLTEAIKDGWMIMPLAMGGEVVSWIFCRRDGNAITCTTPFDRAVKGHRHAAVARRANPLQWTVKVPDAQEDVDVGAAMALLPLTWRDDLKQVYVVNGALNIKVETLRGLVGCPIPAERAPAAFTAAYADVVGAFNTGGPVGMHEPHAHALPSLWRWAAFCAAEYSDRGAVPVVAAWHGTTEEAAAKILAAGMPNAAYASNDSGRAWVGEGFYTSKAPKIARAYAKEKSTKEKSGPALLAGWVAVPLQQGFLVEFALDGGVHATSCSVLRPQIAQYACFGASVPVTK